MIAEAVDTAITLGWALAAWIVLLAAAGSLAVWTLLVAAWWAGRVLWRIWQAAVGVAGLRKPVRAPLAAERPSDGSQSAEAAERRSEPQPRRVPSWAHTDHHQHEDAA